LPNIVLALCIIRAKSFVWYCVSLRIKQTVWFKVAGK